MLHKLTKAFVDKIPFEKSSQVFYRDSLLTGFALRVGKTAKVYIAESKLYGKTIRVSIAKHNVITLDEARNAFKQYDNTVEGTPFEDCPSGQCDLK